MMNERIRQLRKLAERYTLDHPSLLDAAEFSEIFDETFAELIVRECIQVGGPEDSYTDEWFKAKADSVAKIKQHFGVE